MSASTQLEDILKLTRELYDPNVPEDQRPTMRDTRVLKNFVRERPERRPDLDYLGDLERKRVLVQKIHECCEPEIHRYPGINHAGCWSGLLALDLRDLQEAYETILDSTVQVPSSSRRVPSLAYRCRELQEAGVGIRMMLQLLRTGRPRPKEQIGTRTENERNENEAELARDRDNRECVATGRPEIEGCHIWPFATSRYLQDVSHALNQVAPFMDPGVHSNLIEKITRATIDGGIIDHHSNIICLSRDLRKAWSDGRFLLEPLRRPFAVQVSQQPGSSPGNVTTRGQQNPPDKIIWCQELVFHWTKRTSIKMDSATFVSVNEDNEHWIPNVPDPKRDTSNVYTWRPLDNGQVIKVYADREEHLPDYDILKLQALLIKAWSLAGGADPEDFVFFWPSDLDDDTKGKNKVDGAGTGPPTGPEPDPIAKQEEQPSPTMEPGQLAVPGFAGAGPSAPDEIVPAGEPSQLGTPGSAGAGSGAPDEPALTQQRSQPDTLVHRPRPEPGQQDEPVSTSEAGPPETAGSPSTPKSSK